MTLPDNQEGPPVDETGSGEVLPRRALDCRQAPFVDVVGCLDGPDAFDSGVSRHSGFGRKPIGRAAS